MKFFSNVNVNAILKKCLMEKQDILKKGKIMEKGEELWPACPFICNIEGKIYITV